MQRLLAGFVADVGRADCRAPQADVEAAGMDLLRRWSEPHRGYHDVRHLTEVLQRLELLAEHGVGEAADPAVRLAAWFHDAVYAGRPAEDETASAELAHAELLALGVPDNTADRTRDLVLLTASHVAPPDDEGAAALCDADLAVLAAPPSRYAEYVAGVRREYAHLDDATFTVGRAALLHGLLERPRLFGTRVGLARWEDPARANMRAELRRLERHED